MQAMQLASLRPLGVQPSGLFGDAKAANFVHLRPKEVLKTGLGSCVKASYSWPGPNPSPFPSRSNKPPPGFQQQNTPTPQEADVPAAAEGSYEDAAASSALPRAAPEAPSTPEDRNFTSAKPPSASSGLKGFNFPGSQIPGMPGTPRPKPGTPRPYDPTKQKSKVMEWLTPPPPPTELLQREHYRLSPTCTCTIYFGDLSKWSVDGKCDAVIAPANKRLNTGPAVNAVLFKAAGTRLLDATQRLPDVAPQGIKAEVGDAIATRAFNLPVSRVIHTVGPVYKKHEDGKRLSDDDLVKAYKTALNVAGKENLTCLAFPPISCRIYGYPYSEGAEIALRTLKENCEGFSQIDIVIRNIEGYDAFIDEANKVLEVIREKKTIKLRMGGDSTVAQATSSITPPALGGSVVAPPPVTTAQSTSAAPFTAPAASVTPPVAPSAVPVGSAPETGPPPAPAPPSPAASPASGAPFSSPNRPFYANPQPRNYDQGYPNQAFQGTSYQQPVPGPYSDPPPRNYRPTYPNPDAGPYSDPPPRTQHPTHPNLRSQQDAGQQQRNQGYQSPPPQYQPPPPSQYQPPPPPPQYQSRPPPPAQYQPPPPPPQYQSSPSQYQPPQYQGQPQYQQPGPPPRYQQSGPPQYQSTPSPQYKSSPPPPPPEYQQRPLPIPPYNPPPPPAQESTSVPPRVRASPTPPSGPPPSPPSSPYEY